ncbi:MAG: ParB N-terminal domain-containing protein, partial [Minisyncoccia bacterium]
MPIGRGLSSLIPPQKKKETGDLKIGENLSSLKPPQPSGHGPSLYVPTAARRGQASESLDERSGLKKDRFSLGNESIFQIEVEKIKPNPFQPRNEFNEEGIEELAQSIREFGIIQPLLVSKIFKET